MSNALVVGGTGFVGRNLIHFLKDEIFEIDCLSTSEPSEARKVRGVNYLTANLQDYSSLERVLGRRQYRFVVNAGGYVDHRRFGSGGESVFATHFTGLVNLVSVLDKSRLDRFVQIGSSDEYGTQPAPQVETMREQPITPYSLAKAAGTHFLQMLSRIEGFPGVVLRLFLTYGPGQNNERFIPQVVNACLANKQFPTSDGIQSRDFLYIADAVEAINAALYAEDCIGEVINVASGCPVRVRDVVERICLLAKGGNPQFGRIPFRPGESMSLYADIDKAKKLLSWTPTTSLDDGIQKMINASAI